MRITNRSLKRLLLWIGIVLLSGGLTGSSCVKDRHVDVVATGELTAQFVSDGDLNTWSESKDVDLQSEVASILSGKEFEEDSPPRATIESVSYRVTRPDPTAGRTITGTITVARNGGSPAQLFEITSVVVDQTADTSAWIPVPLTEAGTTLLNGALHDVIANPGAPLTLTFSGSGTSNPADVATDFAWETRVRLNIVGKQKFKIFQPL